MREFLGLIIWGALSLLKLHAAVEEIPIGDHPVRFEVMEGGKGAGGILFVSLHSNETTGVAATKKLLPGIAAKFVAIQAGGERRLRIAPGRSNVTIDPNRMFTRDGIDRDLKRFSVPRPGDSDRIEAFAQLYVNRYLQSAKLIVALHNNTPGALSILSYKKGGSECGATREVYDAPGKDPDDFFLVTESAHYEGLKKRGFNVVLQKAQAPDDGSLSVYCGRKGMAYINVEAGFGAATVQREMIQAVLDLHQGKFQASEPLPPEPASVALAANPASAATEPQTDLRAMVSPAMQFPLAPTHAHTTFAKLILQASQGKADAISRLLVRAPEASKDDELARPYGMGLAEVMRGIGPESSREWMQKSSGDVRHSVAYCLRTALGVERFDQEFSYLKPTVP